MAAQRVAAEAAARHLPLEAAMLCPFTGRRRAALKDSLTVASSLAHIGRDPARFVAPLLNAPGCATSAVPCATISNVQEFMRPLHDLAQVERLLEDGTGVVLEPGANVVRLGVAAHDGDASGEVRVAVNQGEVECQPRHGGELDVEQHGIGGS